MLFMLSARTPFWMNIVAGPTISYFTIAMNIIIIVALFPKNIRSPTTIVMQGLALADGLTALCTYGFEPFFNLHYEEIIRSTSNFTTVGHFYRFDEYGNSIRISRHIPTAKIEEMKWLFTLKFPYCLMHYYLANLVDIFHLVSILLTTCLGLQKFLAVACPIWSKTQITENRSVIVCVTCFLLTLTVTMPRLFVVSLSRGQEDTCLVSEPHQTLQKYVLAYHPIFYAIVLVGAVVTMLISTCFIIFTLCRRKRVRGHVAASRAEKKSCILIVLVMTVFFLSEVPRIFVRVTVFSTYGSNLDSWNVASQMSNTRQYQTYSECLSDDIFGLNIFRLSDTRNRSCISNYKEIPSKYKAIVERGTNRYVEEFPSSFAYNLWSISSWFGGNIFKDKFHIIPHWYPVDLGSLGARKIVNRIHEVAHDLAVELYCANEHQKQWSKRIRYGLMTYFFESDEAQYCKIDKLLVSSFFLGSSPYSEQMNYILNITSGYINITLEHLKLFTEILKFSMIIGCGSNFLIYIIMSKKLREALKKTFRCGGNQNVRADVMEMQRRT